MSLQKHKASWHEKFEATRQEKEIVITRLNDEIKECLKRESSLKDQLDTARQDKEKLMADSEEELP